MKKLLISILFVLLLAGTGWAEGGDSQSFLPTGIVIEWDGDITDVDTLVEPIPGWYWMNGAIASDTAMPVLAARINKKHNRPGDPTDSTRLADRRGVFGMGFGSNSYLGANYSGASGTPQLDRLQGHGHYVSDGSSNYAIQAGVFASTGATTAYSNTTPWSSSALHAKALTDDGANGTPRIGITTRPASVGTHYIIKY